MTTEIERKFLVKELPKNISKGKKIYQGYLSKDKNRIVRVRIVGQKGFLTIKGVTEGISRIEYEYTIPVEEAQHMLDKLCLPTAIEKIRYDSWYKDKLWEIDVFQGDNSGLIVAEIELTNEKRDF